VAEPSLSAPVVLLIFNRPESTARVFAEIARARPPRLLVVADGPRPDRPGEQEKCMAARAVIERVNWDCEVLTNYSEVNLGCRRRVSSGLDWAFQTVDEAIILEDDCVPHPTFFRFCDELLPRYRDDERVFSVCGTGFAHGRSTPHSYYYSHHSPIWGWATWRRAWQHYDVEMALWPTVRDSNVLRGHFSPPVYRYWHQFFEHTHAGAIDTWDYQWHFACWIQNGLSVLPTRNLISNIGYGQDATHTVHPDDHLATLPLEPMVFPLRHPPYVMRDVELDDFIQTYRYGPRRLRDRLRARIARIYRTRRRRAAQLSPAKLDARAVADPLRALDAAG